MQINCKKTIKTVSLCQHKAIKYSQHIHISVERTSSLLAGDMQLMLVTFSYGRLNAFQR